MKRTLRTLALLTCCAIAAGCQAATRADLNSDEARAVNATVERYVAAARAGDAQAVAAVNDPTSAVSRQAYEMKEINGEVAADGIIIAGDRAMMVSQPVEVNQPSGFGPARIVFTLDRDAEQGWRIDNVVVQEEDDAAATLARFARKQRH